ncbi:MAG TPA: hypothetical protein VFE36_08700 [Candidatus Baltobacteraceae bacterium]|jgi:uncharacterized membrane protein|nr:hypothetical protein [Candidatus Baltobacteraceae bacterium]
MSVSQPPSDTPFGLQPNVAAGLAYLFGIIGGIVMLVGGGTNAFVKWAAAQSITLWGVYIVLEFVLIFLSGVVHFLALILPLIGLVWFILWLWTMITAFQGKEVRVPVIADITTNIFKSAPAA